MNQPNIPPGYGTPQPPQYPPQGQGPVPHSASYPQQAYPQQPYAPQYPPPPQGIRGMTRQMFNPASYRQQGSASWGVASFILALVGWLTLGCLGILTWPLAIIFGFIGLIGRKRSKGLAFAGLLMSLLGIGAGVGLAALGFHEQFQGEKIAASAGAPIVAAIDEFKTDNKRVPNSLEELVEGGYVTERWDEGHDDLSIFLREFVKGKKWTDFLRYKPGGSAEWKGDAGFVEAVTSDNPDELREFFKPGSTEAKEQQTYGLAFVGLDNKWGGADDYAVAQAGEKFDLQKLWGGGDQKTREITKKKRELQKMLQSLETKAKYYDTAETKAQRDLSEAEDDLRRITQERKLDSYEQVKADKVANEHLQLIGETQKRLMIVQKKRGDTRDTHAQLKVKVKRLANQEEMAKLADSPQAMAELDSLLEDSKKALDETSGLGELDKLSEQAAAEQWFKEKFK